MTSKASVDAFIGQPALALVGLSRSGKKFGNLACRELTAKGYRVYPIHPAAETIDGRTCYRRFADLPEPVDAVLVVVPALQAATVVREAAAAGIHHVWLQQGAESPEVLQACRDAGVDAVSGECILMFAKPTGYHKAHRWIWQLLGRLPRA
jgi:predicted CoA-binding protein